MDEPVGTQTGGKHSARQSARRAALEAQSRVKAHRIEREKRLSSLGVEVAVALGERDAAVHRCEVRAGTALLSMTAEGVSLSEAIHWCRDDLTRGEAGRMRDRATRATAGASSNNDPARRDPAKSNDRDEAVR